MDLSKTIGFLGGGNMAEALIRGLVKGAHVAAGRVLASGPRPERMAELAGTYGIRVTGDNCELARQSQILVLSVKPQIMDRVPGGARVVRAMPNTPAVVGAGATAIARGSHAEAGDLDQAKFVFDAVGITVVLEEQHLDAVTGLSGSGPAYIFLIIEALSDAGVKVGLSRRTAQRLAAQTVMGSAKLLLDTDGHPGQLKDMVTSPGGTAIAGLHTLEQGGLRTTLINAVEAATLRSRELGRAGSE